MAHDVINMPLTLYALYSLLQFFCSIIPFIQNSIIHTQSVTQISLWPLFTANNPVFSPILISKYNVTSTKARIYKIHKNAYSSIYSYCLKMIKMYNRTEFFTVISNYMHNRIQTAVTFKNLLASMLSYTYKYNGFFTILNHILQCLKSSQTHFEVETHISIETRYKHNKTKQKNSHC